MPDALQTPALRWHLADLDFSQIDVVRTRERDELFFLVCSASLIESGSNMYTDNLLAYFSEDTEVCAWLVDHWKPEELQHGRALKAYVCHVWPEFDWDRAYAGFLAEYSVLCHNDKLEPTRGQEMVARCIVEMGTTTYYQTLNALCGEPILQNLSWRIRNDEIQHYRYFYRFFLKYQRLENLHRVKIIEALWRRIAELRHSDAEIALRHAIAGRFHDAAQTYSMGSVRKQVYEMMVDKYPIGLAVRMTLKPLRLNARLQQWIERPLGVMAQRMLIV